MQPIGLGRLLVFEEVRPYTLIINIIRDPSILIINLHYIRPFSYKAKKFLLNNSETITNSPKVVVADFALVSFIPNPKKPYTF